MEARRRSWRQKYEDAEPRGCWERQEGSGEGAILREAAWTESPGHRGLAALQSRQKPGRRLERGRAPPQPTSRPPLSIPSPGRAVHSPPPHRHPFVHPQQSPSITHDYTCLSPCSTQPHAHSGWQDPGAPGLPGR